MVVAILMFGALIAGGGLSGGTRGPSVALAQLATVTLKVTDTETGLSVDNLLVFVDGIQKGKTDQAGELDIAAVDYGRHRIMVLAPNSEKAMVERYVDVASDVNVPVSIDMPNPVFEATLKARTGWWFNEYGFVDVTMKNVGAAVSEDTTAIVSLYVQGTDSAPVATRMLDFQNMAPGGLSVQKSTDRMDEFVWGKAEYISVVVIERYRYTPQNMKVIVEGQVPASIISRVVTDVMNYIRLHPEIIGQIAQIFLKIA
jgi:hypothetical protein